MIKYIRILLVLLSLSNVAAGNEQPINILGIGNSFTRNATNYLPQIIESESGIEAHVGVAIIGGCSLRRHAVLAKEHEADETKGAKYAYKFDGELIAKGQSLKDILLDQDWDFITIQQVSSQSYKIDSFYPYTQELIDYIRQYRPNAEIVVHETWAHSPISPRVEHWNLQPKEMYDLLHANYAQIAKEFDLRVIPVGTAMQIAKEQYGWEKDMEPHDYLKLRNELQYPEDKDKLPTYPNSLHNELYWGTDRQTKQRVVAADGFHANVNGQYLGSLVWYEFFFGQDAESISYKPDSLTPEQASSLKSSAHMAMQNSVKTQLQHQN